MLDISVLDNAILNTAVLDAGVLDAAWAFFNQQDTILYQSQNFDGKVFMIMYARHFA